MQFTWQPFYNSAPLFDGATMTDPATGVTVTFGGSAWVQYQYGGQLALSPSQHGETATLTFAWSEPVAFAEVKISGLQNGGVTHIVGLPDGWSAMEHHNTAETAPGWVQNVQQWSHDGGFIAVGNGATSEATFVFATTGSGAPWYTSIRVESVTWAPATSPIPEPSIVAAILAVAAVAVIAFRKHSARK